MSRYYYDTETSLYYLQSRYYDANTGRFINADGLVSEDLLGTNFFAYCNNNPVNMIDSDGHFAILLGVILLCAAVVTVIAVAATYYCSTPAYQRSWNGFCGSVHKAFSNVVSNIQSKCNKVKNFAHVAVKSSYVAAKSEISYIHSKAISNSTTKAKDATIQPKNRSYSQLILLTSILRD